MVEERVLAERVHRALDWLSPKKRIAFLLFAVEGHSIPEVAALMGAGKAATKSRIWFARRELLALARKDPALREMATAATAATARGRGRRRRGAAMSALQCMRMRALLLRAMAGQASEAERLELESHLGACQSCRAQHDALTPVRALRGWSLRRSRTARASGCGARRWTR